MKIENYYVKFNEGVMVIPPHLLPDYYWINPRKKVPLKDADGNALDNVEQYGYKRAIDVEESATYLVPIQLTIINNDYEISVSHLTREYPESEKNQWITQETESIAWEKDNTIETPYIDILAQIRGIDRVELINRILLNSQAFKTEHAILTAKRQKLKDMLESLPEGHSVQDVLNIKWR